VGKRQLSQEQVEERLKMKNIKNKFLYLATSLLLTTACSNDYKVVGGSYPDGSDTGTVVLDTGEAPVTTPTTPTTPPPLTGNPVAVCEVTPNPVRPPVETAVWDGSASHDLDGWAIVSHEWTIIARPDGSTTGMAPDGGPVVSNAIVPDFQPDLAGEYTSQLVITNELGETDTCEATLEAIPAENLWIEMYWTEGPDDMDLHLANTGAWMGAMETGNDCYYANCTPGGLWGSTVSWGPLGGVDDPSLDLDDIYGLGPENINITQPAPGSLFTVVVHDYTGSTTDTYGDNDVTVNVYINGVLEWTDTKVISGDGSYTPYCYIDWSTLTVSGI